MNANAMTARERILHYAGNCAKEFGWSSKKAVGHIFDTHPHLVSEAVAENEGRKFENPMDVVMEKVGQYDRDSHQTYVRKVGELFRLNPDFAAHYERQVKGGNSGMRDASREIAQRAVTYSKENSVDIKTATREVMAEDPLLAQRWHFGSKSTHRYQEDSEPMEGIEAMGSGSAYQRVGSVVIPPDGTGRHGGGA